jgi:hypothetical protein
MVSVAGSSLRSDDTLAKMRSTFAQLEADRTRWKTATPPPAGSPLADDDQSWLTSPLSSHARQCLVCAWDHFDLVRLTIDQKRAFPTATYSVLRGSLLGAAQALWLLSPDDQSVRRERGLATTQEWLSKRIQWQHELTPDLISIDDAARSGKQLKRLDDDLEAVKELREQKFTLNGTNIVKEAAEYVYPDASLVREAVREWRRLGGDAHALGWPLMGQSTSWGSRGPDGLTEANVIADLVSVANAYLLAWTLYRAAIARLDELSTAPTL